MSERPETPERSEMSKKLGRPVGAMGSDVFEKHFSVRVAQMHIDIIDRLVGQSDKPRAEVVREMIEAYGSMMDARQKP